ncbi:MAG: Asp-tRNA(Asn)/Glu-tRNA(Gln) amidotransferase subunit GatA [Ignavibacteriae bacterium]|nr:Asp-tRNA(Asn)/Glu-tRNA(Gln) amidotransferase subunit GatA [Ignavibacteriota bacterium]
MLSYSTFREAAESGIITSADTTRKALSDILSKKHLNAFLTVCENEAFAHADKSDEHFSSNSPRLLEGMTIALKDNISTKGIRTTCASKILENFIPVYDATIVERMNAHGGVIVGKTNLDEFAMGSSNENSAFGAVEHPLGNNLVPGGSSGGSTVAVAAGLVHAALGSDTGGSVRQPAALCGVVGFKPTYGRISRYGMVAFASSLDQIGILAADVPTTARFFDAISGNDEHDSTTAQLPPTQSLEKIQRPLVDKFTVAVLPDSELAGCDPDVLKVYYSRLDILRENGATVIPVEIPGSNAWIPTYYILATAEASSNLARFDGVRYGFRATINEDDEDAMIVRSRTQGFGAEVKRRIMLGTYVLSSGYYDAYYRKAQKARRLVLNGYNDIFEKADVLFLPTTPTPAFKRGEKTADPVAMYLSDYFTVSANLAGIPAISIPAGKSSEGLPIGMQLQAKSFDDEQLLYFAHHFFQLFK